VPSRTQKYQAHAEHLLDSFIALRQRYAMLEPMLVDRSVAKTRGAGARQPGFKILRLSLFLTCAQDIAKLSLDADARTPSIRNIAAALDDLSLLRDLEDRSLSNPDARK
jgi:hypothetical protein